MEDDILASIIKINDTEQPIARRPTSVRKTDNIIPDKFPSMDMTPANGIHFSLRELFLYLTKHDITRAEYFKVGTLPEHNPTHPRILCSQTTFYRRYSNYLTTQILPHIDDFGLQVGPRQICSDPCLPQLNFDINNTVGYSERTSSLAENLQQLKANENIERGAHRHVKQPSVSTTKLYQLLSCKDDPKIHLVKEKS